MKRNIIYLILAVLILSGGVLWFGCTNALKNVDVTVNSDIFKYTTLINVTSSSGKSLDDATVTISGSDASKIYNLEGYQTYSVAGGFISLAVDPNQPPINGDPIEFNVTVTKSGYLPINIPVTITPSDSSTLLNATMIDISNPPAGVTSDSSSLALTGGNLDTDTTIGFASGTGGASNNITIGLDAGTQFKNAAGTVIGNGTNLDINVLNVDASNNDALTVFPGGALSQGNIHNSNGVASGALLPAGLVQVTMTLNGQEIKGFSTPIQIKIPIDPNFVNPATDAKVQPGDNLAIYSYSIENGFWQYENVGPVVSQNGNLFVTVTTLHLTWFMVGSYESACGSSISLKLNADWLTNDIESPISFKVYSTTNGGTLPDKIIASSMITAQNGDTVTFNNIPNIAVIIKAYDIAGNVISTSSISSPCGAGIQGITLAKSPLADNPKTTMQLYVRCPNDSKPITVLPTFYLYFKITGSPDKDYVLLGKVVKGYISTNLLDVTKMYDFKAVWGSNVKVVNDKSVSADNTATVGDNQSAGELIGSKAGATNLEMLKENCSDL